MKKKRRQYTREFKLETLQLLETSGKSANALEEDMGLGKGCILRWKREMEGSGPNAFPGHGRLTPEQERLKAAFVRARGYWTPWTEGILRFNPSFLDVYVRYGGYPAEHGPLSPMMRELLYVDASPAGKTSLTEWARAHAEDLGRRYASELARRKDRSTAYENL